MIVFMDGFDQFQGQSVGLAGIIKASGYNTTGTVSIGEGRISDQSSMVIGSKSGSYNNPGMISRTIVNSLSKVIIGFAYKATAVRDDIVNINDVGVLSWNAETGKLSIAGGTGTATVLLNLWYYIEIVIDKAEKTITLFVNNGQDLEAPLPSTAEFNSTYFIKWESTGDSKHIDDFIFIDNSTGPNVQYSDRVGPIQITARLPSVDVDKEWSPSTGVSHWPLVANRPPKDTDFVQSNVSGAIDSYLSNTPLPDNNNILAVGMAVYNRKSDIDARQLGMVIGAKGDPQIEVIDTELSITNKYSYAVFEKAPGGALWDAAAVTTQPFGVIVRP